MNNLDTVKEILEHIVKVCIRNSDGSLSLGTYEVELLEKALTIITPHYPTTFAPCEEDMEAYDTKGQGGSGSNDDIF